MSPLSWASRTWTETANMTKYYTVLGLGISGMVFIHVYTTDVHVIWGPIRILYISAINYNSYTYYYSHGYGLLMLFRGHIGHIMLSRCIQCEPFSLRGSDPWRPRPKPWWWGTHALRSLLSWHPCPCQWRWTQPPGKTNETNDAKWCEMMRNDAKWWSWWSWRCGDVSSDFPRHLQQATRNFACDAIQWRPGFG